MGSIKRCYSHMITQIPTFIVVILVGFYSYEQRSRHLSNGIRLSIVLYKRIDKPIRHSTLPNILYQRQFLLTFTAKMFPLHFTMVVCLLLQSVIETVRFAS